MYHHITLKELRPQLPQVMSRVDEALERFVISKRGTPIAVLLSLADYESLLETLNEVSDRANLQRIRRGLKAVKSGKTVSWKKLKQKHHLG